MPTATRTYVFAADAEGLTDQGLDANLAVAWVAGDGNPAGALEWLESVGTSSDEKARKSTSPTWETEFTVPAGSTVTDVQVTSWDSLRWTGTNVAANGHRTRMRIVDSGGTIVHSAGDLIDATENSGVGGTPTAHGAGTSRAVDATYQPSSTAVKLEIQFTNTGTGGQLGVDYEHDNIVVVVTYTAAGPATPPFVPHRMPLGV